MRISDWSSDVCSSDLESYVGPYWSITKFDDIMAVDTNHKVFSSEAKLGGIAIQDMHSVEGALELEMFIAMDPPKHDQQRKAVTPAVEPSNLLLLEPTIRERACQILDDLPDRKSTRLNSSH